MSQRSLRRAFLIQKYGSARRGPSSECEPRFLKIQVLIWVVCRSATPEKEILVNANVFGECVPTAVDNRLIAPAVPGLSDVCGHRGDARSRQRDRAADTRRTSEANTRGEARRLAARWSSPPRLACCFWAAHSRVGLRLLYDHKMGLHCRHSQFRLSSSTPTIHTLVPKVSRSRTRRRIGRYPVRR